MEHLLASEGAVPIDIPYVSTEEYDGGDFLTYPQRKGWSEDELMGHKSFGDRKPSEVEAFFQTWLYFGCLISAFAIIGIEVKTIDFIRETEKGQKLITTHLFPGFIQDWATQEKAKARADLLSIPDQYIGRPTARGSKGAITAILNRVRVFVDKYCSVEAPERAKDLNTEPPFWPISPHISLSIMAAAESFEIALTKLCGKVAEVGKWGSSSVLNQHLLDSGWCPREMPIFDSDTTINSAYFFASYPCPHNRQGHGTCTTLQCNLKNVDTSKYVTRHVTDTCQCEFVPAPEEVKELVKANEIPVVSWKDGSLSVVKFDRQAVPKMKYVAISHV